MNCSTPGFTISQSLLKFMFIESVVPSNHLILCSASFPLLCMEVRTILFMAFLAPKAPREWGWSKGLRREEKWRELGNFITYWCLQNSWEVLANPIRELERVITAQEGLVLFFTYLKKIYLFIYLAASGLSCSIPGLYWVMQESFIVAPGLTYPKACESPWWLRW